MEKKNWLANAALYVAVLILACLPDVSAASMGLQVVVMLLIGLGFSAYFSRLISW